MDLLESGTAMTEKTAIPQDRGQEYRSDIDGLRAIAIVSVVLFHAGVARLSGGFVGVDVFFVISGYLIGAHIYRDVAAGRFRLAEFYRKRAKRILPALFFLLLGCYTIALLILTPLELASFARYAISSVFSYSNVVAWLDNSYFGPGADQRPLLMTWSLGVEEQFYVIIPLLMLLLARVRRALPRAPVFWGMAILALASFALSVWGTMNYRHSAFYLLPSRAWELLAGVLMAIHEAAPAKTSGRYGDSRWADPRSLAGVAAILFAVLHYGPATIFPGLAAVPPVLGAALVLSAPGAWLNRIVLSSKPFRWIGLVSYSWYLWHWPLLSFAHISADLPVSTERGVEICGIALALAWISYRFVEQPFRHSQMPARRLLPRYALASLLIALPALAMTATEGLPGRFPIASAQDKYLFRPHPCMGAAAPVTLDVCLPPDDGRPAVALMGDSHADALMQPMQELAQASGVRLDTIVHGSCAPLIGVVSSTLDPNSAAECLAYNRAALDRVAGDAQIKTVVLASFWAGLRVGTPSGNGYLREGQSAPVSAEASDANLKLGLSTMVKTLHASGKRVVILQDEYALRFDAYRRLKAYMMPLRGWVHRWVQGETATPGRASNQDMDIAENQEAAQVIAQVAAEEGATLFDLRSRLCDSSSCAFYADGVPLYLDTNHLSAAGVRLALQGFPLVTPDVDPSHP